jgi:hypothetical protein
LAFRPQRNANGGRSLQRSLPNWMVKTHYKPDALFAVAGFRDIRGGEWELGKCRALRVGEDFRPKFPWPWPKVSAALSG